MLTADEARALGERTTQALRALESLLTTEDQHAAAEVLHRRLHRVSRAVHERWADLFPNDEGGATPFSTGGDKDPPGGG